ncbi:MAG: AMP-binding protein [Deltaproteobacteria bacterium]|nr:AMP-binding protein [Deltaproteobacteria bacterium]MBW2339367.1 AMP-binding protein [Deltaproteobacteria bacterium]
MFLEGFTPYRKEDAEKYNRLRWWAGLTFGDILDKAADIYPDKEALVDDRSRLTYSQVREKANRLAISLVELGVKEKDRVLVQLPNWNEFVYSYFALQKIGAIPVLLIARYRQYEINHLCHLTDAAAWIVPDTYGKVDYLPIIDGVLKDNPQTKHVIVVRGKHQKGLSNLEKLIDDAELSQENLSKLAEIRPDPMQVAHMGPTGGTTGLPKVVPRTHNDYLCRAEYVARGWELNSNDTLLAVAPVGHDLTSSIGVIPTIFTFGKVVMLDSTEPGDICRAIERERITALAWTPALAYRLVNFEGLKDYDMSSLQKMYCGGGASPMGLIRGICEKLGCIYINAYGGTEGMNVQTRLNDDIEMVYRTVGKPTCPYDTYKVVGEKGKELPPNTSGELVVKGPGVFTGYYNAPEENEKAFDKDGFFRTGDLAMFDDSGNIILTGRLREVIKRGGESISAVEIENLIVTHPEVDAVAVIGMPDPELGERPCAYIQSKPGAKLSFDDIISFLKSKNASVLQLPERVEFIDSLPLTKARKLDKRALEEDIKRKIGTS